MIVNTKNKDWSLDPQKIYQQQNISNHVNRENLYTIFLNQLTSTLEQTCIRCHKIDGIYLNGSF